MVSKFNLLYSEAFPVSYQDDPSIQYVSLSTLFSDAHRISDFQFNSSLAELPATRLLLSILYRSSTAGKTKSGWVENWEAEQLDIDPVMEYLHSYENRFDFINSETPFYQIPDAEYIKETKMSSLLDLIVEFRSLPSEETRALTSDAPPAVLKNASLQQALEYLLILQNYRTASKKSIIKGDTRTKKKFYAQMGWLGNFTGILLKGRTLKETLLLNLVPYSELNMVDAEKDVPVWENPPQTAEAIRVWGDLDESALPEGPAQLYTWQIARVSLKNDGERVIGAVVGIGDRIFSKNKRFYEPMTSWRIVKMKDETYFQPYKVSSSKVWQKLPSLLSFDKLTEDSAKATVERAKTLAYISELLEEGHLDRTVFSVRTFEVNYGTQDAVVESSFTSSFDIPSLLLLDADSVELVNLSIQKYKESEQVLNFYIKNLSLSSGSSRGKFQPELLETYTYQVGHAFEQWLESMYGSDLDEKENQWIFILKELIKKTVRSIDSSISLNQLSAKSTDGNDMNYFTATRILNSQLKKAGLS